MSAPRPLSREARRTGDPELRNERAEIVRGLSPAEQATVLRAFDLYFLFANIAE
jgi:hypothetical protein